MGVSLFPVSAPGGLYSTWGQEVCCRPLPWPHRQPAVCLRSYSVHFKEVTRHEHKHVFYSDSTFRPHSVLFFFSVVAILIFSLTRVFHLLPSAAVTLFQSLILTCLSPPLYVAFSTVPVPFSLSHPLLRTFSYSLSVVWYHSHLNWYWCHLSPS